MQGINDPEAVFGRLEPSHNAGKAAGEWEVLEITLVDRHVTLVRNGSRLSTANRCLVVPVERSKATSPNLGRSICKGTTPASNVALSMCVRFRNSSSAQRFSSCVLGKIYLYPTC